ncbi:MAG: hypothetical protein ABH879_03525 [archaeon]
MRRLSLIGALAITLASTVSGWAGTTYDNLMKAINADRDRDGSAAVRLEGASADTLLHFSISELQDHLDLRITPWVQKGSRYQSLEGQVTEFDVWHPDGTMEVTDGKSPSYADANLARLARADFDAAAWEPDPFEGDSPLVYWDMSPGYMERLAVYNAVNEIFELPEGFRPGILRIVGDVSQMNYSWDLGLENLLRLNQHVKSDDYQSGAHEYELKQLKKAAEANAPKLNGGVYHLFLSGSSVDWLKRKNGLGEDPIRNVLKDAPFKIYTDMPDHGLTQYAGNVIIL